MATKSYTVKSGISEPLKIKVKVYKDMEKLVATSCGIRAINHESGEFVGVNAEGEKVNVSIIDAFKAIKKDGVYGFIEVHKAPYKIHMWYDKKTVKMPKLIGFLGHELGHVMDFVEHEDPLLQEEFMAERFGEVATFSYELAKELLGLKK